MPLREPPSGDPWLKELVRILNTELSRKEPLVVGLGYDGVNLTVRFRVPYDVGWVQVHVQGTGLGEGGPTYDSANYVSTTRVDCRANRLQDAVVPDAPEADCVVFLVPIQKDGAGAFVLYDGQDGRPDAMAFVYRAGV